MRWTKTLRYRLRSLVRVNRADTELDGELRFHLEKQIETNLAAGMSAHEAREAALREFGGMDQIREEARDARGLNLLYDLGRDVRLALRQLRRSPGFTAVVVLSLALGIGANTAIFTLAHAMLMQPLPVAHPEQLYRLGDRDNCCVIGGLQGSYSIFSYPFYLLLRDHTPQFSELAAFEAEPRTMSVRRSGSPAPAQARKGQLVSGNYFSTLGVVMAVGRGITPADDRPGAAPVAVMSFRAWEQDYALDPTIVGANVSLNGSAFTVVGVAARGFFGEAFRPQPADFWLPLSFEPTLGGASTLGSVLDRADRGWLYVMGRLRAGASVPEAQARVNVELQQWLAGHPEIGGDSRKEVPQQHIVVTPGNRGVTSLGDKMASSLYLLFGISGLLLLIACANIANLLLARGIAGRAHTAVQLALGASRGRLLRQALAGSAVLAFAGGLAALFVAYAGTRALLLLTFPEGTNAPITPVGSRTVLGFAFALAFVAALVFGLVPAWLNTRGDPAASLHGAGRGARDPSSFPSKLLLVFQVALSFILLSGAGLFTATLRNLEEQRFGFQTQGRMMVQVDPALAGYSLEQLYGLNQEISERLSRVRGVAGVSYSLYSPMEGQNWADDIAVEGRPPGSDDSSSWDRVGPNYFEVVGTRVLRGRSIGPEDTAASPHVAVVNETFVRRFLSGAEPIGKHLGIRDKSHVYDYEIVGVVEDAIYRNARKPPRPMFFIPYFQMVDYRDADDRAIQLRSNYIGTIALRYSGSAGEVEQAVRRSLGEIDPNLLVLRVQTFDQQLKANFTQERNFAGLSALFSALALLLAAIGLYGVTAYRVVQRTSEIGLRIALGSSRVQVLRMVLREVLLLVLAGVAIGVPGALAATRTTASFLFGLTPEDPGILAGAVATLAGVALMAGFLPALRASRVDPMTALRHE
ncbi:MAG TPA: ABC transporter permease [Candidatus Acidoferrales bacterium]|nr:ABC transporter permease [Candidatus Acidoferrales bacterium]